MAQESEIEWTDATWNPWYGCQKVSPGCAYCYMDRWAKRSGRDPEKVTRARYTTFYAPLKWREPRRVFTCSLSDFFIEEADRWRTDAWSVIRDCPQHTWMILTKRVDRILKHLPWCDAKQLHRFAQGWPDLGGLCDRWSWPNVNLGVSVENQYQADERIPKLLQILAAKRFVSIEPSLGPITLKAIPVNQDVEKKKDRPKPVNYPRFIDSLRGRSVSELGIEYSGQPKLDWVIVGGESGGPEYRRLVIKCTEAWKYRPLCGKPGRTFGVCLHCNNTGWEPKPEALRNVRSLRDQCQVAGVPFFFKQWGGPKPESGGRLLDGREWSEFPK